MKLEEAPANFTLKDLRSPWSPSFKVKLSWSSVAGAAKYRIYAGNSFDDPDCPSNWAAKLRGYGVSWCVHKFKLYGETSGTESVRPPLKRSGFMGLTVYYVTAVDEDGNESPPSGKLYVGFPDLVRFIFKLKFWTGWPAWLRAAD